MKRLIPIVLVLLVLAACGAPAAEVTVAASPGATPSLRPEAALPRPPVDFAPESCYLAEEFGDRGQALLLMSADGQFKCRYSCWVEIPETGATELMCGSFTDSEATAAIEGDALTLGYAEEADYPRPERFSRVPEDEAIEAHMNMPFNDETVFPIPVRISHAELEAMTGVELVREENGEGDDDGKEANEKHRSRRDLIPEESESNVEALGDAFDKRRRKAFPHLVEDAFQEASPEENG